MSLWVNRVIANVWQSLPLCLRSQIVQNHRLALSTAQPHLPLQIHQCHPLSHLGVLPDVEALPASDLCSQATTALM
jgi:hypothetical protein